jgi:branched-chain amino acid transport system permease protein
MDWINILIQGALLGGFYALFAIGLSMSFGIMRLVNIAHGDLIVLSAYVALVVTESTGLDPFLSLVIVVPVMFVLGYAL